MVLRFRRGAGRWLRIGDLMFMCRGIPWCCECRAGEHDNCTEDVDLFVVRDPDTNKIRLRGYLCTDHQMIFLEDNYTLHKQ